MKVIDFMLQEPLFPWRFINKERLERDNKNDCVFFCFFSLFLNENDRVKLRQFTEAVKKNAFNTSKNGIINMTKMKEYTIGQNDANTTPWGGKVTHSIARSLRFAPLY